MEKSNDQPHHQTSPSSFSSLPSHEDVCKYLFGHHRDSMYQLFERFYGRMVVECSDLDMDEIKKAVQNGDKKEALKRMNRLFKAHTASGDLHRMNAEIHAQVAADCSRGYLTIDQDLLAQHIKKGISSAARSVALCPANLDNHYVLASLLSLNARDREGLKLVIQKCKEALEIHDSEETRTRFWKLLEGEIFRRKEFILESFIKRYFLKVSFSDLISFVTNEPEKAFLQQSWDFVKSNLSWKFYMCCCCEDKFDSSGLLFKHIANTHLTLQAKLVIVSGKLGNTDGGSPSSEGVQTHETLVLPHAMSEDLIVNASCLNTGTSHAFPSLDTSITNTSYRSELKQWQNARECGRQKGAALLLALNDMSGIDTSAQGLLLEALQRLSRDIDAKINLCSVWIFPFPYHKNKENQLRIRCNPFKEYNFSEVMLPAVKSYISAWVKAETHLNLSVNHHTSASLQPHHQQEPPSDFGEEAMQLLNAAFERMWEAHYSAAVGYYGLGHVVVKQYEFFKQSGVTLDTSAILSIMSTIEGREGDNAPADFYRIQAEYYKDCSEIVGEDITTHEAVLKGIELAREAVRRSPKDIRNHAILITLLSLDDTMDDRRRHDNILAQCHHALLINKSSDGEDEQFETARSHVSWFLYDITRLNRVQANWASTIIGSHIAVPICAFKEFCTRTCDADVLQLVIKALEYGNSQGDWKFWQCCCCPMEFTSSMELYNHIPNHLTPEAKIALSSGRWSLGLGWCPSTSENDNGTGIGFIRIDTILSRLLVNPSCLIGTPRRSTSATNLPFQDPKISKVSYKSELMEWASLRQSRKKEGTLFIKTLENIYISGVEEGYWEASVALREVSTRMDYAGQCNPFGAYDYTDALLPLMKSCIADKMEKEADEEALALEGSGNE